MKMLAMLPIATALAMLGMLGSGNAGHGAPNSDNDTVNDGNDASPDGADILVLTATSNGDGGGPGIGEIIVTMTLQGNSDLDGTKYRVLFDYTGTLVTGQTPGAGGCELGKKTSDNGMKFAISKKGSFKDHGPGTIVGQGTSVLVFTVGYDELAEGGGVTDNTDVFIWADTHQSKKKVRDRAPDTGTMGGDTCGTPEQLSEVLAITTTRRLLKLA